jgi:BASS family bile acid:Na+ symporter
MELMHKVAMLVFVLSSMVAMGLGLTVRQILAPLHNVRLVGVALLANFVLMPLSAVALAALLRLDHPHRVGLLLLGVAAGAPFLPHLVQRAKGNLACAVGLMLLLMVTTVGYLPLVLPVVLLGVAVHPAQIACSLCLLMLLPLAGALALHATCPATAARAQPLLEWTSTLSLLLVIMLLTVLHIPHIFALSGTHALVAGLVLMAMGYGVGWWLGGPAVDTRLVLGLGTAQHNIAAALVVGSQSFRDRHAVSCCPLVPTRILRVQAGRGCPSPWVVWASAQQSGFDQVTQGRPLSGLVRLRPSSSGFLRQAEDGQVPVPQNRQQPEHHHHDHARPERPRTVHPTPLQEQVDRDSDDRGCGIDVAPEDQGDLGRQHIPQDATGHAGYRAHQHHDQRRALHGFGYLRP